jgi:hypothetical protein
MLTKEEEAFIEYWSRVRQDKKKFLRKFSIGLPLAALIVAGTILSMISGWYKKADMTIRSSGSAIIVVLVAGIGIIVFITIFSAHHKWDQNELHYHELLARKDKDAAGPEKPQS